MSHSGHTRNLRSNSAVFFFTVFFCNYFLSVYKLIKEIPEVFVGLSLITFLQFFLHGSKRCSGVTNQNADDTCKELLRQTQQTHPMNKKKKRREALDTSPLSPLWRTLTMCVTSAAVLWKRLFFSRTCAWPSLDPGVLKGAIKNKTVVQNAWADTLN